MLVDLLLPLAPAVILLLGAFILSVVWGRLPPRRFDVPALIGLVLLMGLFLRFRSVELPVLLSGWNFSTVESVTTLAIQTAPVNLAFLWLTLLILLAISLAWPLFSSGLVGWLAMGAGACLLFVSANRLTIAYMILAFDLFATLYWLRWGEIDLGIARLFLSLATGGSLLLAEAGLEAGLAVALWLRLGFYPLLESLIFHREEFFIYLALSLMAGLYLAGPVLPEAVRWLAVLTLLLNGLLTWLSDNRLSMLIHLALAEISLLLLIPEPGPGLSLAWGGGVVLSLAALWLVEKPDWLAALPAACATLTLAGLPFSLAWPGRNALYGAVGPFILSGVVVAEGLALSGLVLYWRRAWPLARPDLAGWRWLQTPALILVPFLLPGLGPWLLARLGGLAMSPAGWSPAAWPLAVAIGGAIGLDHYRARLLARWPLTFAGVTGRLRAGGRAIPPVLDGAGKILLRGRVLLEGQHYMGWALLIALIGSFIILLGGGS